MTEKGQEQGWPCWVVAGPFAARLGLSKSQSDVLTRCWWLLPCQALIWKHPPAGVRPPVNVTHSVTVLCSSDRVSTALDRFKRGRVSAGLGSRVAANLRAAEPLLGWISSAWPQQLLLLEIKMVLSRSEAWMVLVCLAHICTSVCSYSHGFLKCVGLWFRWFLSYTTNPSCYELLMLYWK